MPYAVFLNTDLHTIIVKTIGLDEACDLKICLPYTFATEVKPLRLPATVTIVRHPESVGAIFCNFNRLQVA